MATSLGAYLTIAGAAAAIDFYKAAFGAEEVSRQPVPEKDGRLMHAELKIFGNTLMLSDEFEEFSQMKSPATLGGTTFNMIVVFETPAEVDAAIARAEKAGATVTMPAEDMFWGDRFGMLRDPFGHMWGLSAPRPA